MYQMVDDNLRLALKFFGRASGKGVIEERDGVMLIDSGVDYAVFNIAMISSPVADERDLDRRITEAGEWYRERKTRWSMWLCEDLLPQRTLAAMPSIFLRHRMRALTQTPGMIAERLLPLSRYLPTMQYKVVADTQSRIDFAHITTICFDIPFATAQAIYHPPEAWLGDYVGYVGYLRGRAIATAAVVISDEAVGLYSVATLPEFRRKGYAEALMRQVLQDAARVSGLQRTVLQATRAGYQTYLKMGWREVTRFSVYIL